MLNNKKWKQLSLIITAVLMVGIISFFAINGTVSADELTPEDPQDILPGDGFGQGPMGRGGRGGIRFGNEAFLQSIADQSGISLEDLQAAVDNRERIEDVLSEAGFSSDEIDTMMYIAQVAVIDQGVTDGKLTEEQAATLKERLDAAIQRQTEMEALRGTLHDLTLTILSEKTAFSVEDLQAAIDDGTRLHALLEQNMTAEEAQTILDETRSEAIDQALAQGLITEEQAQILQDHPGFGARGGRMDRINGGCDCDGDGMPDAPRMRPQTGMDDSSNRGNRFGGADF